MTSALAELRARLPEVMLRDQRRLGRQLDRAAGLRDSRARQRALDQLRAELDAACARVRSRSQARPGVSYPAELPVSQRAGDIAAVIRDHQVVIVAGETGSGKTTQLPKICLALGRGVTGQIGHTQPRRIAARTVAERISAELGTELGTAVGYTVRFADAGSDATLVRVMTDGILLAELARDRQLLRYDTLIIDEAHERSLNIDFILGYLRRLLPQRPGLKVIITSATIDVRRFSAAFGDAPVIEVSGRSYPVEVRYRPLDEPTDGGDEPRDQVQGICDAVAELLGAGPAGDILVFLSGEREIRDTAEALAGQAERAGLDVLPLYSRLPAAEQHRVFQPHQRRRVVLATNVAETSLTVPGIKYVIDPGTARISRYSRRTKVQRLPIEPVSRASAGQRAGRCGRTSNGVCIRLYSETDYAARPEFTDPEILRTSLASVILQMAALDLGEVAQFPFLDPPDSRQVADGVRLLAELGALAGGPGGRSRPARPPAEPAAGAPGAAEPDAGVPATGPGYRLTETGRKLARLPADPRLGRMILAADDHGCVPEVLVIAAALSIVDPRERPADARAAADALHARFAEGDSDFLALVNLWDYLRDQQRELSASALRRLCRREYLHYLRVREWQDVHAQLRQAARDVGIGVGRDRAGRPGHRQPVAGLADQVHMSLLAGLLSQIGMLDTSRPQRAAEGGRPRRGPAEFAGARGARFAIFPDSALARKPPPWVVAAELVETSRLWARTVARIEPEWAERLAPHLVQRSYSEPHWDARRGAVMAAEKVTLYGLPLVAARPVSYGRIDPAAARDIFIQHALVEGDWRTHHKFFAENKRLLAEAAELERRARRRGLVADDAALFDFYDQRIPASVTSARHFDSWWKQARQADPGLLTFAPADLLSPAAQEVPAADYPLAWTTQTPDRLGPGSGDRADSGDRAGQLAVSYEFAPGTPDDGVTVDIPLHQLSQVDPAQFSWQVPGRREELVTELIRSLPKQLRTAFAPAPQTARAVLEQLGPPRGDLRDALAGQLQRLSGRPVPRDAFDLSRLPEHLAVRFRIAAESGELLASGRDLARLRDELRPRLQAALSRAAGGITRTGLRRWELGSLPREFGDGQVRGYPALADAGDAVDVRLFDSRVAADAAMLAGTRRLILLNVASGGRAAAAALPVTAKLALSRAPYPSPVALVDDCAAAAADQIIAAAGGPAWDADAFARLLAAARADLARLTAQVIGTVSRVLAEAHEVEIGLDRATGRPAFAAAVDDMRAQLAGLIHPGFVAQAGPQRLPDLLRYLRGMNRRLDKAPADTGRDAERMATVHRVTDAYQRTLAGLAAAGRAGPGAQDVRWLIEELRISLFAQVLGTAVPVSEQRISAALDRLAA